MATTEMAAVFLPITPNKTHSMNRSLKIVTGYRLPALEEQRRSLRLKQSAREALQVINRIVGEEFTAKQWGFVLTLCGLFIACCTTSPLLIVTALVATALQLRSIRKGGEV